MVGRRVRGCLLALVMWGVVLIGAPSAGATTFCVLQFSSACPNNGSNVIAPTLEAAMQSNASDGIPDTVLLEANNYISADSVDPAGSDPLTVQGAGTTQTTLLSTSNVDDLVLDLAAGVNLRSIVVRDLQISVTDNFPDNTAAAASLEGDTLLGVDIRILNPGADGIRSVPGGGSFINGRIYAAGAGSVDEGIIPVGANAGTIIVDRASIENANKPLAIDAGSVDLLVTNSRISTSAASIFPAVYMNGGTATVRNSVLRTSGQEALGAVGDPALATTLAADHVTAINSGGATNPALTAFVGVGNQNATVAVSNSILRGYPLSFSRSAPVGPGGDASISARYSNLVLPSSTPGTETNTGDGTLDLSTGNTDQDPLFVSVLDPSLQPASPSIDKGDPADAVTLDILGLPRPNDGNGDGSALTDQGAFEYQRAATPPPGDTTPPQTKKGKGPKAKTKQRKATFRFSSSEAGSRFQCKIDKKAYAGCKSPRTVKGLKLGKHVVLVRAIDAAGNIDSTPARFAFRVVPKRSRG